MGSGFPISEGLLVGEADGVEVGNSGTGFGSGFGSGFGFGFGSGFPGDKGLPVLRPLTTPELLTVGEEDGDIGVGFGSGSGFGFGSEELLEGFSVA